MQGEGGGGGVAAGELEGAVVEAHDLAGEGEAYAGAFLFGGVERDEDFLAAFAADRSAVVGDVDYDAFGSVDFCGDGNGVRSCLQSILHEVHQNLRNLALVGIQEDVFGLLDECAYGSGLFCLAAGELYYSFDEFAHEEGLLDRGCDSCEVSVRLHEPDESSGRL